MKKLNKKEVECLKKSFDYCKRIAKEEFKRIAKDFFNKNS